MTDLVLVLVLVLRGAAWECWGRVSQRQALPSLAAAFGVCAPTSVGRGRSLLGPAVLVTLSLPAQELLLEFESELQKRERELRLQADSASNVVLTHELKVAVSSVTSGTPELGVGVHTKAASAAWSQGRRADDAPAAASALERGSLPSQSSTGATLRAVPPTPGTCLPLPR